MITKYRNLYVCPPEENNQVKHISVAVNKWKYRLQYKNYFGGVTALSKSQVCRKCRVNYKL